MVAIALSAATVAGFVLGAAIIINATIHLWKE